MLYSAAGVTLPTVQAAPPMTTHRPTFSATSGARTSAWARFVSGPSVTRVSPGWARTVSTITAAASPVAAGVRGGG